MYNSYESNIAEYPSVHKHGDHIVVSSHINQKGRMVLTKTEAALLILELKKFLKD